MTTKLEQAMAVYLTWRQADPRPDPETVLRGHAALDAYLRPMLLPDAEHGEHGEHAEHAEHGANAANATNATNAAGDAGDDAAAAAAAPEPDAGGSSGRVLGGYRLLREIGRGGMGVVHEAYQPSLGRFVALKILTSNLTHDPATLVRFRREATTAARLQHPGIAQVLEFGADGDQHFLAMQLVRGVSLETIIKDLRDRPLSEASGAHIREAIQWRTGSQGSRTTRVHHDSDSGSGTDSDSAGAAMTWSGGFVPTIVEIIIQVAETLEYAHAEGVIHRDVKPSNILVQPNGRAVLVDFGLAREEGLSSLTMTGDFAGSPYYVSPEQGARKSSELDRRTDLFSLGITLYEALTLRRPFEGSSPHEIIDNILTAEPAPPNRWNPALAPDLVAVTLKAIEKPMPRRYQTAAAFAADLRAFLQLKPVTARYPTRWIRMGRWVRREPLQAILVSTVLIATVLSAYVWISQAATAAGARALRQQKIDEYLVEAWFAQQQGDNQPSRDWFRAVLDLDPGNPRAIFGFVIATFASTPNLPPEDIIALIERLRVPGRGDVAIQAMCDRYGKAGSGREVIADMLSEPQDPLTLYALATRVMPTRGDADADNAFRRCRALLEAAIFNSQTPRVENFLSLALVASRMNDRELDRRCANALLRHWPDSPPAAVAAAVALMYAEPDRAIRHLQRALVMRPDMSTAHATIALYYSSTRELELCAHHVRRAAELRPTPHNLNLCAGLLARYAVSLQDPADAAQREALLREALECAEKTVAAEPDNGRFLMDLAFTVERLGDRDRAWELMQRVVVLAPRFSRAHRSLIGLARIVGQPDAIRAEHERWLTVNPNGPTAHREWAEYLLASGTGPEDLDRALAAIRRADRLTGGRDPFVLVTLAEVLDRRGEPKAIPMVLDRAQRFLPEDDRLRADLEHRMQALRER